MCGAMKNHVLLHWNSLYIRDCQHYDTTFKNVIKGKNYEHA